MSIKLLFSTAVYTGALVAGLTLGTGAAIAGSANVAIYPYASAQNFCPSGLQPISISGVICCGTPNQTTSYQQMVRHASVTRRAARPATRRTVCPVGEKGCVTR